MTDTVVVDVEINFHNEDETGYVWAWLADARDPGVVTAGRIVVVGDEDAIAMAQVVDLIAHDNGVVVHLAILPGTVSEYVDAVARTAAPMP